MAGKASEETTLAFNSQAAMAAGARAGKQTEWRIDGVRGLVLVVQPSGVGTYYFRYDVRVGGKRKFRTLKLGRRDAMTLHDARRKAETHRHAVEDGADPVADAVAKATAMTFRALAEQFLAEAPLAATTRRNYRQYLEKDAYPAIGDMPASDVTADYVVNICKDIEARGNSAQSQSAKTAIGGVYRYGVRQRLVKANPCAGIGRRSPVVARTRTLTDGELATLWGAIDGAASTVSQPMRLILQLAILTGQRRTEVAGARVSELQGLDTDAPVWVIPGDVNKRGKIIEGRTKNGREQRVPLSTQGAALFRRAVALSGGSEYVFPADLSKVKIGKEPRMRHTHGGSVTSAMRRLRAAAGIDDVSVHDMRRAISNWLKDQGFSREVRDLILNHKDGSVTEAHYSNSARMEKQVRAALQAWADHVWTITDQREAASNVVEMKRA
jgi:integrase